MTHKKLELAVYVSALMLAIGVFLPLTELPGYGAVSYNRISPLESYLVVLCAIAGPALIILGRTGLLIFSAIAVWVVLLFPAIKGAAQSGDESLLDQAVSEAAGVMGEFAGDFFLNIFEFSWGGFVFLIGLLVYTVSSIMRTFKGSS